MNNQQTPINVSIEGKDVAHYSGQQKSHLNGLVTEHSEVDFFESLYNKRGQPNSTHYYWRVSWFDGESGPILIVSESGYPQVVVKNLKTGKQVVAFKRALGINWAISNRKADGKIALQAKLGFSTETIDDVESLLVNTPKM